MRRASFGVFVANAAAAGAALATAVVTARALGAAGRGQYSLAMLLAAVMVTLGGLGFGTAATFFVARERSRRTVIAGSTVLISAVIGLVLLATGLAVVTTVKLPFRDLPVRYVVLAAVSIPFALLLMNVQSLFLGLERFREWNAITFAQAAVPLLLVSVALYAAGAGAEGVIGVSVVGTIVIALALVLWLQRTVGIAWRLDREYLRRAAGYGIRTHVTNAMGFLGYRLDILLVGGFLSPARVGLYTVAVATGERLWMLSQAASTVLFPRIAAEEGEGRTDTSTPFIARNVLYATALGAALVFALSRPLVTILYSDAFEAAVTPLRILLPGIVLLGASRVLANDLAARNRPTINAYIGAASLAANVVLNVVLIPAHGIAGAAAASTVSYSLAFVLTLVAYASISGGGLGVLAPQRSDLELWRNLASVALRGRRGRSGQSGTR
jgi:O-antigen/teichoic acid export membrane protein